MSFGIRGFVEFLINEIEKEGILGSGHSNSERENDVIDKIWKAYEKYIK